MRVGYYNDWAIKKMIIDYKNIVEQVDGLCDFGYTNIMKNFEFVEVTVSEQEGSPFWHVPKRKEAENGGGELKRSEEFNAIVKPVEERNPLDEIIHRRTWCENCKHGKKQ